MNCTTFYPILQSPFYSAYAGQYSPPLSGTLKYGGIVMLETTAASLFHSLILLLVHLLEMMGVLIILVGATKDFILYFTKRTVNIRLDLARSLALGLEFKLGGEILRTVIARDIHEMLSVGAIILLRAALSFLIHWEIGHIEKGETPSDVSAY